MPRLSAKEIREQIQERIDDMQALDKLRSDDGDREFTDEEQKQWDGWQAEIGQAASEGNPATGLNLALERAQKFETTVDGFRNLRSDKPVDDGRIVPARAFRHKRLKAYKEEAHAYKAGQFLAAALWKNERAIQWCNEHGVQFRDAMSGADNMLGGFLVPEEMEAAVIDLREEYGVFRREARIVPMASDTKIVPRRTSGVTAYFVAENGAVTASDKGWDQVNLTARKLAVLCKYSSELAEDAIIDIGDDLTNEIAYAFANKEDECGWNGTGTSTYGHITGVLPSVLAGSVYDGITGNTAFSTIDLADFEAMVGKLPQYAEANAKWYISRAGYYASMARLMDAGGGNNITDLAGGTRAPMFLGYPVVFTQVLNSTLTAQVSTKLLAFGDLRQAAILGNRRGLGVKISDQRYLEYDQIGILGTERFDINVHEIGTATVAGSIIVFKAPGS
jgi:HK97 family phage major capsid protein